MKISSLASLAVFAAILGSGLFLGRNLTRARIPAPAPLPAEAEGPPPRSTLLEKGDWYLARGELDRAAAAFEEAAEFAPSIEEAKAGLREVGERKRQACLGNVEKLGDLLAWLDRQELKEEAEEVAWLMVKLDRRNAVAHRRLGHTEYEGEWYEEDQMDIVRVAQDFQRELEERLRMTRRQLLVKDMARDLPAKFNGSPVFLDCGPEAPWLIACEPSEAYSVMLRLDEFALVLKALFAEFSRRFPGAFDAKRMKEEMVLPVYAFRDAKRYRDQTMAPYTYVSHYDRTDGCAYLSAPESTILSSLLHEGTHLLVMAVQRLNGREKDLAAGKDLIWMNAGLACQFEAFRRDGDGKLVFEGIPPGYLKLARERLIDAERPRKLGDLLVMHMEEYGRIRAEQRDSGELDGEFWSAVYFFMHAGNGKYREWFVGNCVKEWREGKGWDRSALGSLEELDGEYREFILGLKE